VVTRAAIEELLRAGWPVAAVARQVGVRTSRVCTMRAALGLPRHRPGPTPAASLVDAFWRRAQPTEDGHLLWPGTPRLRAGDHRDRPARVAFRIGNGRDPVGYVCAGCTLSACVHPRHVEDQPMRAAYSALFGAAA